jgi:hypothetical protein
MILLGVRASPLLLGGESLLYAELVVLIPRCIIFGHIVHAGMYSQCAKHISSIGLHRRTEENESSLKKLQYIEHFMVTSIFNVQNIVKFAGYSIQLCRYQSWNASLISSSVRSSFMRLNCVWDTRALNCSRVMAVAISLPVPYSRDTGCEA